MSDTRFEIDGRAAARGAWRELLLALPEAAPRELLLVDADFADWPFDEPAVIEALTRWVRLAGRRMVWIGDDFEAVDQRFARLAAWRRDFAHAVEAFAPVDGERIDWPCWLLAERCAVVLVDRGRWRGRNVTALAELRAMREACDAFLQRCEPAWPGTVLGL